MSGHNPSERGIWLAIILLASLMGAALAGGLFHVAGAAPTAVLGASGAAFMGVTSLGIAVHRFMIE